MWFKKKVEPTLEEQLVAAKAKLARYEQLPASDFTIYPNSSSFFIKHGVDQKPLQIARVKANIAELEVLIAAPTKQRKEKS